MPATTIAFSTTIIAWLATLTIAIVLIIRGRNYDKWNGIFLLSFSFVQFLEFGLWIALNNGSVETVSLLTSIMLIALWIQPFVQSYAGYYYVSQKGAVLWQEIILVAMSFVYVGLIAYALIRAFDPEVLGIPRSQRVRTTIGPNGHLVWVDEAGKSSFISGGVTVLTVLFLLGLFVPILFMGVRGLFLAAFGLISLGVAYWLSSSEEVGSYWSYFSVLYGLIALAL